MLNNSTHPACPEASAPFQESDLTTREKLLQSGLRFFSEYGYKSASLRKIAADAGFTSGAFYGYFASKADLFYAITEETAEGFARILDSITAEMTAIPAGERRMYDMCSVYVRRTPEMVDFLLDHPQEMHLLLTGAEGTRYENLMEQMQNRNIVLLDEINDAAQRSSGAVHPLSPYTMRVLISGYFSMLSRVILDGCDRETACRCMTEIARLYEYGILGFVETQP